MSRRSKSVCNVYDIYYHSDSAEFEVELLSKWQTMKRLARLTKLTYTTPILRNWRRLRTVENLPSKETFVLFIQKLFLIQ